MKLNKNYNGVASGAFVYGVSDAYAQQPRQCSLTHTLRNLPVAHVSSTVYG